MSGKTGFWKTELEQMVQKLGKGGAFRVIDDDGKEILVKVEEIDPARVENEDAWA